MTPTATTLISHRRTKPLRSVTIGIHPKSDGTFVKFVRSAPNKFSPLERATRVFAKPSRASLRRAMIAILNLEKKL